MSILLLSGQSRDQIALHWAPLGVLDVYRSQWLVGVNVQPVAPLRLVVTTGIRAGITGTTLGKQDHQLRNFRAEIQMYPFHQIPVYWAWEGFYVTETYSLESSYYRLSGQPGLIFFDAASVSRQFRGGCIKAGAWLPLGSRVRLDMYAGLGVRERRTTLRDITHPVLDEVSYPHGYDTLEPGQRILPHLALGFRLGYVLLKDKRP